MRYLLILLVAASAALWGCSKIGVGKFPTERDGDIDYMPHVQPPRPGVIIFPYERDGRKYLVFVHEGSNFSGGIAVVEIRPTPAEYDINEEWPGRYDNATESWEFPPEMGTDIPEGYKPRISKRGNPAYPDYIDTEER